MKIILKSLAILSIVLPILSQADTVVTAEGMSEKELALQEKARKRLYPGGRDEEDLKVDPSATVAFRKVSKKQLEKEVYKQLFNEDLKESNEDAEESDADMDDGEE